MLVLAGMTKIEIILALAVIGLVIYGGFSGKGGKRGGGSSGGGTSSSGDGGGAA